MKDYPQVLRAPHSNKLRSLPRLCGDFNRSLLRLLFLGTHKVYFDLLYDQVQFVDISTGGGENSEIASKRWFKDKSNG